MSSRTSPSTTSRAVGTAPPSSLFRPPNFRNCRDPGRCLGPIPPICGQPAASSTRSGDECLEHRRRAEHARIARSGATVRRVTDPQAAATAADDAATRIAAGYAVTGPALELGAVVHGGGPHPDAQVRVPLSMLNRHGLIAGATGTGKTKT